jgi:polyhydroxyalkanoate synthesis regulator phasin
MNHELEINHDEAKRKSKSIMLKSKGKMVKGLQAEDEAAKEAIEDVEVFNDDELDFLTRRVQQLWKKRRRALRKGDFPSRG